MTSSLFHPARILICAADLVGRAGLTALLQNEGELTVVGQVAPSDDLTNILGRLTPDVVLWDLGWHAEDAVTELSECVDNGPPLLALIEDAADAALIWATGVRGLLLRNGSQESLHAALVALANGLSVFDPDLIMAGVVPLLSNELPLIESLTPREMDVLQVVAQGLSNKLIARHLAISEHTVKFHINAILGKLGAQSRTEAVVRATRAGLIRL